MFRFVAPAGAPVKSSELLRDLIAAAFLGEHVASKTEAVATRLQVPHIFGASSGRAALWLILKALSRLRPNRDVVGLPAYTCFSVAASIARCGLRIYPIESDPETLDFDSDALGSLPEKRVLCLLTSNLFGFVNDTETLERAARASGAFLVDDAAQALGSVRNGRLAGTAGDAGFYSLAGGKAWGTVQGGLIVTHSETIARVIREEVEQLQPPSVADKVRLLAKTTAYATFLHPRLFWIPSSLPFLKLGRTEFNPGFNVRQFPHLSAALLQGLDGIIGKANGIRRNNAAAIAQILTDHPGFVIPRAAADCRPGYIRLPVLARDARMRQKAIGQLREAGIGASPFYPTAICDIPGIDQYMAVRKFHRPRAEQIAEKLFTLPTHAYVGPAEIERMTAVFHALRE